MSVPLSPSYQPHIDGLRAVAILPVVAYHADIALVSGGFTGVDIFFVISGYLLTRILVGQLNDGTFSLAQFYKRRALRILPAYLAMIVAVGIMAYVMLLPSEVKSLGFTMAAASAFVSNFYFWRVTSYFNPDSVSEPLLHTWTLSVEEQFYLVLPIALYVVWRVLGGRFVAALVALTLGSFVVCLWGAQRFETATFYLLPFRAWEFGAGALLAALGSTMIGGRVIQELASAAGMVLVTAGFVLISGTTTFPGWWTLLPVVGACLLIVAGPGTFTGQVMASGPMVFIGKISYSLYLWHWPVIVFYKLRYGGVLDLADTAIVLGLSFALAVFSTRFIENPFRTASAHAFPAWRTLATSVGLLVLAAVGGVALSTSATHLRAYPEAVTRIDAVRDHPKTADGRKVTDAGGCMIHDGTPGGFSGFSKSECLPNSGDDDAGKTVLILGDSHAAHLMETLRKRGVGLTVQRAAAARCTPLLEAQDQRGYCGAMLRHIFQTHLRSEKIDRVILSARWREGDLVPLLKTVAKVRESGADVVVLGPTVEYTGRFPQILARSLWLGTGSVEAHRRSGPVDLDRLMRAASWPEGVGYISMLDVICPKGETCRRQAASGQPYHFDYGHYTWDASQEIAGRLVAEGVLTFE